MSSRSPRSRLSPAVGLGLATNVSSSVSSWARVVRLRCLICSSGGSARRGCQGAAIEGEGQARGRKGTHLGLALIRHAAGRRRCRAIERRLGLAGAACTALALDGLPVADRRRRRARPALHVERVRRRRRRRWGRPADGRRPAAIVRRPRTRPLELDTVNGLPDGRDGRRRSAAMGAAFIDVRARSDVLAPAASDARRQEGIPERRLAGVGPVSVCAARARVGLRVLGERRPAGVGVRVGARRCVGLGGGVERCGVMRMVGRGRRGAVVGRRVVRLLVVGPCRWRRRRGIRARLASVEHAAVVGRVGVAAAAVAAGGCEGRGRRKGGWRRRAGGHQGLSGTGRLADRELGKPRVVGSGEGSDE